MFTFLREEVLLRWLCSVW